MNDRSSCKRRYTDSVLYWLSRVKVLAGIDFSRESFCGNCG
jgi:hypothetical protein